MHLTSMGCGGVGCVEYYVYHNNLQGGIQE